MSINPAAKAAQDAARQSTGEFGTQHHNDPGIVPVPDLRFSDEAWATDLERAIREATNGRLTINQHVLRRVAGNLLHGYFAMPLPHAARLREEALEAGTADAVSFDPADWARDLNYSLKRETHGTVQLTDQQALAAADLLIRGDGDEWLPHAAQVCNEAAAITVTCPCGRTFQGDRRAPQTHCTVCVVQGLRDTVERIKEQRRHAEPDDLRTGMAILNRLAAASRDNDQAAYQDALRQARETPGAHVSQEQILDAHQYGRRIADRGVFGGAQHVDFDADGNTTR